MRRIPEKGEAVGGLIRRVGVRPVASTAVGAGLLLGLSEAVPFVQSAPLSTTATEAAIGGLIGLGATGAIRVSYSQGGRDTFIGALTTAAAATGMLDVAMRTASWNGPATVAGVATAALGGTALYVGAATYSVARAGAVDPDRRRALHRASWVAFPGIAAAAALGAQTVMNLHPGDAAFISALATTGIAAGAVTFTASQVAGWHARRARSQGLTL